MIQNQKRSEWTMPPVVSQTATSTGTQHLIVTVKARGVSSSSDEHLSEQRMMHIFEGKSENVQGRVKKVATTDGELMDAKIAAAEARTDTKFGELLGELKLMNQRLDHVEKTTTGVKTTVVVTGLAAVGLVVAIIGWGSQMFGLGMDAQTVADKAAQTVEQRAAPQIRSLNTKYDTLNSRLDEVLKAVNGLQSRPPTLEQPKQ